MSTLELRNIHKSYGAVNIIKDVSLSVHDREFVVLVGPSGCGKSTLLRMIAGLEEITGGELTIDGELMNDVSADARGLAMVFQSYALYPHMSVSDNMGFALKLAKVPESERNQKILQAAKILQLEHLLERKPSNCPAANGSASRLAERSSGSPKSSCSTSRCRISMRHCASDAHRTRGTASQAQSDDDLCDA